MGLGGRDLPKHSRPSSKARQSELDDRAPPETVQHVFGRMPQHDGTKELWRVAGVGHAKAFRDRPVEYDAALGRLLQRLRR